MTSTPENPPNPSTSTTPTGDPETPRLNPGSPEAIRSGCRCPVMDNNHGRGWMGLSELFVYSYNCPLHKHKLD